MGYPRTGPAVLRVLTNNPNQPVTVEVISAATDLEPEQVKAAVARMIKVDKLPIRVLSRARVWQYDIPAKLATVTDLPTATPVDESAAAKTIRMQDKGLPAWVKEEQARRNGEFSKRVADFNAPRPAKKVVGRPARNGAPRGVDPIDTFIKVGNDTAGNPLVKNLVSGAVYRLTEI